MEFEQKAEEKKMSMSKNIARLAVTAGLTAALSFGGVMAPVTMAFAAGTPVATTSGNVTINEETYKDTTFKVSRFSRLMSRRIMMEVPGLAIRPFPTLIGQMIP